MNIFAGVIGGIWLIILGKWQIPVVGLGAALLATNFLFPLLMLPSFGLAKLSLGSLERGNHVSFFVLQACNWLINLSWITLFVYVVFATVLHFHSHQSLLPFLLVAYGLAAGPLGEMTVGEEDSEGPTRMIIVLVCVGMIAMTIALLLGMSFTLTFIIFLPFVFTGVVWGMVGAYAAKIESEHGYAR